MSEHTWAALAEISKGASLEKLATIVAALCRHNQGQPGGGGSVPTDDPPPKARAKPKRR